MSWWLLADWAAKQAMAFINIDLAQVRWAHLSLT
jgi:hypothetical protein